MDLCEHFITINELGGAVFKALKALLYDGIHFLVGVGTWWSGMATHSKSNKSK